MDVADTFLGVILILVGVLLAVAGVGVAIIIPREVKKWDNLLKPLLDMFADVSIPELPTITTLLPMILAFVNMVLEKVYNYGKVIGYGGGGALVGGGIVVVILGIAVIS